ncbi:hypothetical protein ACQWF0_24495, partial [Salmonella enterica subsp. enterica serovar Infantis]
IGYIKLVGFVFPLLYEFFEKFVFFLSGLLFNLFLLALRGHYIFLLFWFFFLFFRFFFLILFFKKILCGGARGTTRG